MIQASSNLDEVIERLNAAAGNLKKELRIAIWNAAKKSRKAMTKEIGKELNTTQKEIKRATDIQRLSDLSAKVVLDKEARPSLAKFKARQTGAGVSAKVSRTKGGIVVQGGFMGPNPKTKAPKLNGNAFKRVGKSRLPILKLKGLSPWGVYVKQGMSLPVIQATEEELKSEIEKRIRYNELKNAGGLNWQQDNKDE